MEKIKNVTDQMRIIRDPKDPEDAKVPTMPLLIVLNNGTIGEAESIRGAATIIMGTEYLDCEDGIIEWHMRVNAARKEAMKALQFNINAVVFDSKAGVIHNNYATDPGDSDYNYSADEVKEDPIKIMVDSDRLFILSLAKLGAISVLERNDSYLLRPHQMWNLLWKSNCLLCNCINCLHKIEYAGNPWCPIYCQIIDENSDQKCGSFSIKVKDASSTTPNEYIDIAKEYSIDSIIQLFEK